MEYVISGDSSSLYNNTLSRGWSSEDIRILKLCVAKFGVGDLKSITDYQKESGMLKGKTKAQINEKIRRLLGVNSIIEYKGLNILCDEVGGYNKVKASVRKNGLLLNDDLTNEDIEKLKVENKKRFSLTNEEIESIILPYLKKKEKRKPNNIKKRTNDHLSEKKKTEKKKIKEK